MNIVDSASKITELIKKCVTDEMKPDGLLSDVETFIPSYRLDEPMDLPAVWLFEHPTIPSDKKGGLSHLSYLKTPFEFVCLIYDEDIEESEIKGKNLAFRVGASILKNGLRITDNERVFNNIKFKAAYPVGDVQIEGKTNQTPATSIIFEIEYIVDWLKCQRG